MLRSEIPSGMCTKLRTVAASNNRDHARNLSSRTLANKFNRSHVNIGRATTSQSILLLLAHATFIMVLFFAHIPFVVNHTIKATPPERLQQLHSINSSTLKRNKNTLHLYFWRSQKNYGEKKSNSHYFIQSDSQTH